MRKVSNCVKAIMGLLCMATMFFFSNAAGSVAHATEVKSIPMITVEGYEVTEGRIVPGNDFTLTLTLKNNSSTSAEDMLINIENPIGVAPVYGKTSQVFVKTMEPGATRVLSFDYVSSTSINSENLEFHVTIVGSANNYVVLRIPTGSDTPFSVVSTSIPDEVQTGDRNTASATFTVLGSENIRDVALILRINGEDMASSAIGIVSPGTTKTQGVSFDMPYEGDYLLELFLRYQDEMGTDRLIKVGEDTVQVSIRTAEVVGSGNNNPEQQNEQFQKRALMIGGILILVLFFGTIIIASRKKKK